MAFCLAIDIGASGGRHILGEIQGNKIVCSEIYRFKNSVKRENGSLLWDTEYLFREILEGISQCKNIGKIPETLAIDTWGVDYVLLDEEKKEILPVYSYRDARTEKVQDEVLSILSQEQLYSKTGIQKQSFNTIYQLYSDKKQGRLEKAKYFLMMPDYFSYRLTGEIKNEYTNASTTNMLNAQKRIWDTEIIDAIEIDANLFCEPSFPGTLFGSFTDEIKERVGFDCKVIMCGSHDTASAVAACPIQKDAVYLSSGTWSLIGMELDEPILTVDAMDKNFTNEGGIKNRIRFLKNIMGMWLFQEIRRNAEKSLSYEETINLAKSSSFTETIDPNDPRLVAPDNMISAIKNCLGRDDLELKDILNCTYHSLAKSYANAVWEIEAITEKEASAIHIVGGGSQDAYLNQLTHEYTQKKVIAGPIEATALGNLIVQMMYSENITLEKARKIIKNSFDIEEEF